MTNSPRRLSSYAPKVQFILSLEYTLKLVCNEKKLITPVVIINSDRYVMSKLDVCNFGLEQEKRRHSSLFSFFLFFLSFSFLLCCDLNVFWPLGLSLIPACAPLPSLLSLSSARVPASDPAALHSGQPGCHCINIQRNSGNDAKKAA